MKGQTIDEFCNKEAGSFKKFTEQKKAALKNLEAKRRARVHAARSKQDVWLAA